MKRGFTLIELLVVIVIIGILVGISSYTWSAVAARGRDSARKSDLARIKQVLQQQYSDTRTYPAFEMNAAGVIYAASWQLGITNQSGANFLCGHSSVNKLIPKFIAEIPRDPKDTMDYKTASCGTLASNQKNRYLYISAPSALGATPGPGRPATGFGLMTKLEGSANDRVSDSNNPLKTNVSPFGPWYSQFSNYGTAIGVEANYLVTHQGQ